MREDFTEEHLKEEKPDLGPTGPHSEVEPASLLVDLAVEGSAHAAAARALLHQDRPTRC